MTRRPPMTQAEKERAAELRERGWSCQRIADHLGKGVDAVEWQLLKLGVDPPGRKPHKEYKRPSVFVRNGFPVRAFSLEEDATLLRMATEGQRRAAIAKALGRRPNSIAARLYTLARRDARAEASAL